MKAFQVTVNGQYVCVAGVGNDGVMGVSVEWIGGKSLDEGALRERLRLIVGGLNTVTREHIRWNTPQVSIGDEVTIRIVEAESVDPESARYSPQDNPESGVKS